MNKKFYSTFLALLLVISLVSTPLSTIVYAENEDVDIVNDETDDEQEDTDENESSKDNEGDKGSDTSTDEGDDAVKADPEVDNPQESDETDGAIQEGPESKTGDDTKDQPKMTKEGKNEEKDGKDAKEEIVYFEDDALREAIEEELEIYSRDVTVSDMQKLESLDATFSGITSLKGLEHAVNLKSLKAQANPLEDISALANLKKLQHLDVYGSTIEDISVLAGLTELQVLEVGNNDIQDISVVRNLKKLQELDVNNNNITDISVVGNLDELHYLNVRSNNIADISAIKNLTSLDFLSISDNNIADISAIKNLTNLTWLSVDNNNITTIDSLSNLTKLEDLDISDNNIRDVSALKNLTKLHVLGLADNNITDISAIENLTNLVEFDAYNNNIKTLPNFSKLAKLSNLLLGINDITDIKPLKELPNLHNITMHLEDNNYDDEATIQWLLNKGANIPSYDKSSHDWEAIKNMFPKDKGFKVNKEKSAVVINLDQSSSKEKLSLTAEQVRVLVENKQKVELVKDGVTTTIPSSVFAKDDENYEGIEIIVNELEKEPNSFSSTYNFTIKQGINTISQFDEGITLIFKVDADQAKNPNNLKVFYKNEETGKWENIGGEYNAENGTVTVTTKHFSIFTVFEAEEIGSGNIVAKDNESSKREDDSGDVTGTTKDDGTVVTKIDDNSSTGVSTEKTANATLPETATNMYNFIFFGLALVLAGVSIFAMRRFSSNKA